MKTHIVKKNDIERNGDNQTSRHNYKRRHKHFHLKMNDKRKAQ